MPNELFHNMGHIIPMSDADLLSDDLEPKHAKGIVSFVRDAFGLRMFKYMRNVTATAVAKGELQAREANATISNATSGTTTSVVKTGAGWTPHLFKDRLLFVSDNDDAAGGAPEGEVGLIVDNTADTIQIDATRPLTTAIAINDDLIIYSLFDLKDAADGDLAINCVGVAMQAVSAGYWGCWQVYGMCPDAVHSAAAVTAGDPVVAGAACIAAFGSDGQELQIGWSPCGMQSDNATLKALVFLSLLQPVSPATAP